MLATAATACAGQRWLILLVLQQLLPSGAHLFAEILSHLQHLQLCGVATFTAAQPHTQQLHRPVHTQHHLIRTILIDPALNTAGQTHSSATASEGSCTQTLPALNA